MSVTHPPKLLRSDEYARDLAAQIAKAREQIAITVTTFRDDDPLSHAIVDELCKAADRGVNVSVCVDTYTYLEPKEFLLMSPKRQPARAVRALRLERELKQHGVSFRWLGRKASAIVYGRTHCKWVVVDDTVYSFGGVNLDAESFTNTDFMMRHNNPQLAEIIIKEHSRVLRADKGGGAYRSHAVTLDAKTSLLFDGGLIADSLIYRRAYQLASEADSILCVSQYSPTGKLLRMLKRKNTKLYFNDWRNATLANRMIIKISTFRSDHATEYTRDNYLHAKFIIFTMPGGSKVALSGSHNFMFGSGAVGTREVAMETTDSTIIRQLEAFYTAYVA